MIEILQDGAALLENKSAHHNIFTRDVESCAVHVFSGDKASLFVHDTGQLSTNSIKNLIEKCGVLRKCISVFNTCSLGAQGQYEKDHGTKVLQWMLKLHEDRRGEIRKKAEISLPWKLEWIESRNIAISKTGKVMPFSPNQDTIPLPERKRRFDILTLNNLFSVPNSQSLKVDLQFKQEQFTPLPKLIHSFVEMERIAKLKVLEGDSDFLIALKQHQDAFRD
jgi:hypothetical protein